MAATVAPTSDLSTFLGTNPGAERIYDNVQVECPTAPLSMIKMALWNAVEDFYLRSTYRRESVYWRMQAGVQTLDFNPFDAEWLVAWILSFDGLPTAKIEPPSVLRDLTFPVPQQIRQGRVLLALKPASFASVDDSLLYSTWFEVILAGTLARLYVQPGKPYTSPQLAQFYARQFSAGVARARDIAQRGYTGGTGRWRFPTFAAGRRKS